MTPPLFEQLLRIHAAFDDAAVPHAFGGAIALAYYTYNPRGTRDLDINVFVPHEQAAVALEALPPEVDRDPGVMAQLGRDGQGRLFWGETPLDFFFDTVEFHQRVARRVRREPLAGVEIPILSALDLVVFKAAFDRTKDWADIEAVIENEAVDLADVRRELTALVGADDARFGRLDEAVRRARPPGR